MNAVRERIGLVTVAGIVAVIVWAWFARPPMSWTFGLLLLVGVVTSTIANGTHVLKRLAGLVPVLFTIALFTFMILNALPGDLAVQLLGPGATPQAVADIRERLNLDDPVLTRFGDWLGGAITGDLGVSPIRNEAVADGISNAFPVSLQLMLYAQIIAIGLAVPLGVYAAYRVGTRADRAINTAAFGFLAMPNFILAVLLVLFFALGGMSVFGTQVGWEIFPGGRYTPFGDDLSEHFMSMFLPALSLAMSQVAVYMRLLRTDMIATLQQNFIDLARAKGISDRRILWRHALRPSSFTLLTVIALNIGTLIGGTVIIEVIFTLPGIGTYLFGAITQRDFLAVQGSVLVISAGYVLTLLAVDLLYTALDPRLRHAGSS